jgi:hypothetical protein
MSQLVFLLEEASAEEMLKGLLPRLVPAGVNVRFITFEGKSDLESNLVRRLRGYLVPNAQFIVLRDKDAGDCRAVKARLVQKCIEANRPNTLIRIACHELESWYLADLAAVERALEIPNLSSKQGQAKFRMPDNLSNPVQELERLTNNRYQKVRGSRDIGPHLDLENDRSRSFAVFIAGLRRLIQGIQTENP